MDRSDTDRRLRRKVARQVVGEGGLNAGSFRNSDLGQLIRDWAKNPPSSPVTCIVTTLVKLGTTGWDVAVLVIGTMTKRMPWWEYLIFGTVLVGQLAACVVFPGSLAIEVAVSSIDIAANVAGVVEDIIELNQLQKS
jgi:hypothetical protein